MNGVSLRSILKPALLSACLVTILLLVDPVSDIWVKEDQLDPRFGGELWWMSTMVAVVAPAFVGLVAGSVLGRDPKKHYQPFIEGGIAAVCGLLVGLTAWAILGGLVHSAEELFASFVLALVFLVLGAPIAFLTGGFVTRKTAWG